MIKTSDDYTGIPAKKSTRERLKLQKRKGESYDDVINRLIDEKENRLNEAIEKLKKIVRGKMKLREKIILTEEESDALNTFELEFFEDDDMLPEGSEQRLLIEIAQDAKEYNLMLNYYNATENQEKKEEIFSQMKVYFESVQSKRAELV